MSHPPANTLPATACPAQAAAARSLAKSTASPHCVVLDTHIVLDLLVFADPHCSDLVAALQSGWLRWLATAPMRDELERVLSYPQIHSRLSHRGLSAETVLAAFDARVSLCPVAPKAPCTCKDPDDQKFIDLAVAQQAALLSKDKAVRVMRKRLERLGVMLQWSAST